MGAAKINKVLFCQVGQNLISKKEINFTSNGMTTIIPEGAEFLCDQIIGLGFDLKLVQKSISEDVFIRLMNGQMNDFFEKPVS